MHIRYLFLIAIVITLNNLQLRAKEDIGKHNIKEIKCLLKEIKQNICCPNVISCKRLITAQDIGNNGYIIQEPGEYCLAEDVNYSPAGTNPAIRISALVQGNVVLNLNNKFLTQNNKNVLGIIGIVVEQGLTNVTIKNGTVRGFSETGIHIGSFQTAQSQVSLAEKKALIQDCFKITHQKKVFLKSVRQSEGTVVKQILVSNVTSIENGSQDLNAVIDPNFQGDGAGGLVILNGQDIVIENSIFNSNVFSGIYAFNVNKITIDKVHCDDTVWGNYLIPNLPVVFGLSVGGISSNIKITNSTVNRTSSAGAARGIILGSDVFLSSNSNSLIENCEVNETSAILSNPEQVSTLDGNTSVNGVFLLFASNATVRNVNTHRNVLQFDVPILDFFPPANGPFSSLLGFVTGFSQSLLFDHCTTSGQLLVNNSRVPLRAGNQGFEVVNSNTITIRQCASHNNRTNELLPYLPDTGGPSLFLTEGFDFAVIGNVLVEECFASGHSQAALNPLTGGFSIVAGFNAHFFNCATAVNPNNCGPVVFRRCVATNDKDTNELDTPNAGYAFGFSTREGQQPGLAGSGPFIFDSCIAESNNSLNLGKSAGFDIFDLFDSKVINCYAEQNGIGILMSDRSNQNNIVSDNVLSRNIEFGILDQANSITNAYFKNVAKQNGLNAALNNYSGLSFQPPLTCGAINVNSTPIRLWQLPNAPCPLNNNGVASDSLDNISIVNS